MRHFRLHQQQLIDGNWRRLDRQSRNEYRHQTRVTLVFVFLGFSSKPVMIVSVNEKFFSLIISFHASENPSQIFFPVFRRFLASNYSNSSIFAQQREPNGKHEICFASQMISSCFFG